MHWKVPESYSSESCARELRSTAVNINMCWRFTDSQSCEYMYRRGTEYYYCEYMCRSVKISEFKAVNTNVYVLGELQLVVVQ